MRLKRKKKQTQETVSGNTQKGLDRLRKIAINVNSQYASRPFEWVGKTTKKIFKPVWVPDKKGRVEPSSPDYIAEVGEITINAPIFLIDHKSEAVYNNRLFDIVCKGMDIPSFVDSGAFTNIMSETVARELFPDQKRRKIFTSGWAQVSKKSDVIDNISFSLNGDEYTESFLIDDDVEKIFHAQIVIGKPTFEKILNKSYGIYFKDLFNVKKIGNIRDKLNKQWLDTRIMHIAKDFQPISNDNISSIISTYSNYPIFLDNYALYRLYHYYKDNQRLPENVIGFLKKFRFIVYDYIALMELFKIEPVLVHKLLEISNSLFNCARFIFHNDEDEREKLKSQNLGFFHFESLNIIGNFEDHVPILWSSTPQHVYFRCSRLVVLTLPNFENRVNRLNLYSYLKGALRDSDKKDIIALDINSIINMEPLVKTGSSEKNILVQRKIIDSSIEQRFLKFAKPQKVESILSVKEELQERIKANLENKVDLYSGLNAATANIIYIRLNIDPLGNSEIFRPIFRKLINFTKDEKFHAKMVEDAIFGSYEEVVENRIILLGFKWLQAINRFFDKFKAQGREQKMEEEVLTQVANFRNALTEDYSFLFLHIMNKLYDITNDNMFLLPKNPSEMFKPSDLSREYISAPSKFETILSPFVEVLKVININFIRDIGVITTGNPVITRKFALIPEDTPIQEIKQDFAQLLTFQNKVSEYIVTQIRQDPSLIVSYANRNNRPNFVSKGQLDFKSKFYDPLKPQLDRLAEGLNLNLTERARRAVSSVSYFSLRNWLIRNEDLRIVSRLLFEVIGRVEQGSYNFLDQFLKGGQLKNKYLSNFKTELTNNPYNRKFRSFSLINNMISQVRNLIFSKLLQEKVEIAKPIEKKIVELESSSQSIPQEFQTYLLNNFERKVQGMYQKIPQGELYEYFLKLFFRKVSTSMLRYAKSKLGGYKIKVSVAIREYVDELFESSKIDTIEQFKKFREQAMATLKAQITQSASTKDSLQELERVFEIAYKKTIKDYSTSESILKTVFRPTFLANPTKSLDLEGFMHYVARRLENKIREHFSRLIINEDILEGLKDALKFIQENIYSLVKIPEFKGFSYPLLYKRTKSEPGGVYELDYNTSKGTFAITLLRRGKAKDFNFKIRTTRKIKQNGGKKKKGNLIQDFISKGYIPKNPTISFRGDKLILNQPFEIKKGDIEKIEPQTQIGVDLGLKDWAAVSVIDSTSNREIARYFLDSYRVFDNTFDAVSKTFIPHPRFRQLKNMSKSKHLSTIRIHDRLGTQRVKPILENLIDLLKIDRTINEDSIRWVKQASNKVLENYLPIGYETVEPTLLSKLIAGSMICYLSALRVLKNESNRSFRFGFPQIAQALGVVDSKTLQKFYVKAIQSQYLRPTNIKFKLMKLRSEVKTVQSSISEIKNNNPDYLHDLAYKKASRELTFLTSKVSRINDEIANQVAHKIVEIAKAYKGTIKLEDLKWSRHSKKQDLGFWLSFWQQHWFFSKIIETVSTLSEREGLEVQLVVARGTSKKCWQDNTHKGSVRARKTFSCPSHKYEVDSDLNAARNIALYAKISEG